MVTCILKNRKYGKNSFQRKVKNMLEFLIGLAVMVPILLLVGKSRDDKKTTASNLRYNEKTDELTLIYRDSTNRKVLKVEQIWNHTFNYEPEKMVYTGATVGGVHTGGFHKEGGYHTVSGTQTGKYQIYYDNGDRYDTNRTLGGVDSVKLANPQLIANAKADGFISKFLQNDTLVLKYGTLSKSDCQRILAWLCAEY